MNNIKKIKIYQLSVKSDQDVDYTNTTYIRSFYKQLLF